MALPFENRGLKVVARNKDAAAPPPAPARTIEDLLGFGFVIIDKPAGCTSHDVVDRVRKILNVKKAGHTGTLDPAVTGVLPVALGRATRLAAALLPAGKKYVAEMTVHNDVEADEIRGALTGMVGTIEQTPPVKSRVKRVPRKRKIHEIHVRSIKKRKVAFRVDCEGGTYIRKLIHDAGVALGTGAHMSGLRRIQAGPFVESDAVLLEELEAVFTNYENGQPAGLTAVLKPPETALAHLPWVWVAEDVPEFLKTGSDLYVPGVTMLHHPVGAGEPAVVLSHDGRVLALGEMGMDSSEIVAAEKGVAVRTRKIFIE